jgi:hypothetical protein
MPEEHLNLLRFAASRPAVTVAFVNPAGRASSMNQAMNSSSPRLYTRRVIGGDTLSSTSAFNLCQCCSLSCATTSVTCDRLLLLFGDIGS